MAAGTALSQLRSAAVIETVAGTTPTTPAFLTSHYPLMMKAPATVIEGQSLVSLGARNGQGISGLPVSGTVEGSLIYGVFDEWFETLFQKAWSTNVVTDGKDTVTRTVENTFPAGVGGTSTMLRYTGCEAVSGLLKLVSRQDAQMSMDITGMGSIDGTITAITGATYADPTNVDPLGSGADIGTITMAGHTLDCMQSLDINFAFGERNEQPKISSNDLCGITRGNFLPVLDSVMYIGANFMDFYNTARSQHAAFAVTIPIGSITGEKYTMVFHQCEFGPNEIDYSSGDIFQKVQILPQYSSSDTAVMTLTRAVA